jgi:hypothetical protein
VVTNLFWVKIPFRSQKASWGSRCYQDNWEFGKNEIKSWRQWSESWSSRKNSELGDVSKLFFTVASHFFLNSQLPGNVALVSAEGGKTQERVCPSRSLLSPSFPLVRLTRVRGVGHSVPSDGETQVSSHLPHAQILIVLSFSIRMWMWMWMLN